MALFPKRNYNNYKNPRRRHTFTACGDLSFVFFICEIQRGNQQVGVIVLRAIGANNLWSNRRFWKVKISLAYYISRLHIVRLSYHIGRCASVRSIPQLFGIKSRVGKPCDGRGNLFAVFLICYAVPFVVGGQHRYLRIAVFYASVGRFGKEKFRL